MTYWGVELGSFAPISTHSTGLGSSSSFTVALIGAIKEYFCDTYNSRELAESACHIELIGVLNQLKQDQYATSFGGLTFIVLTRKVISPSKVT